MASVQFIKALAPTQRDPTRLMIRVAADPHSPQRKGRVVATLPSTRIEALGLQIGQPWTDQLAAQVEREVATDQAHRFALNSLNRRMASRSGMQQKLRKRGVDDATIEKELDRLEQAGLINDEAYGRALIRDMLNLKPAGPRLMQAKLMQKGLSRSLIDRLVAEMTPPADDQADAARDLVIKRLRSMDRFDTATKKRRLWGMLARRGFDYETIERALDVLREE